MRSNESQAVVSERITSSPSSSPSITSMVLTEARPSDTRVRRASSEPFTMPEQADLALALPLGGAAHVQHVLEPLELDDSVHAEVRPGALGQLPGELHVHRDGAVLHRGVHALHPSLDLAVAGVHGDPLADLDVLGLGLGDPELRLESVGPGHSRQVDSGRHPLSDLDRHLLKHAVDPGADLQRVDLAAPKPRDGPDLLDLGALHLELGLVQLPGHGQPLLLEVVSLGELLGGDPGQL